MFIKVDFLKEQRIKYNFIFIKSLL